METQPTKAKTGPKPENGIPRVRLCGYGPWVRPETDRLLKAWRMAYGNPVGRSIDDAVMFAAKSKDFFLNTKHHE